MAGLHQLDKPDPVQACPCRCPLGRAGWETKDAEKDIGGLTPILIFLFGREKLGEDTQVVPSLPKKLGEPAWAAS